MEIANNNDRLLAAYIRTVIRECGSIDKALACMATILVEFRNGTDVFKLAADIAEHG